MLAIPPALLDQLYLQAGSTVGLSVINGVLVIDPKPQPRYKLKELLAASEYEQPLQREGREWVDAPAAGRELIMRRGGIRIQLCVHRSQTSES